MTIAHIAGVPFERRPAPLGLCPSATHGAPPRCTAGNLTDETGSNHEASRSTRAVQSPVRRSHGDGGRSNGLLDPRPGHLAPTAGVRSTAPFADIAYQAPMSTLWPFAAPGASFL